MRYGGVDALHGVSLTVERGHVLGLIGPNGAGKTTLVNATTGLAPLASGTVALDGARLDGLPPHRIARAGIARTYQNIRLFGALDVRANLAAGAYARPGRLDRRVQSPRCSSAPASPHVDLERARRAPCRTATSAGSRSRGRSPPNRRC